MRDMSRADINKSQWISKLKEKIPDRRVGLVPADAFFTRKVDLPDNLGWDDLLAFIQLNLEGNAPFPMDQLVWGFFHVPGSEWAFVYATPLSRLRKLDFDEPSQYFQLFPGFVSLYGERMTEPMVRFIAQNGVLSALFLQPENPVPEKIVSRKVEAELLTDDAQLKARARMERSLKAEGYVLEEGLWLGEGVQILHNENLQFNHRHLSEGKTLGMKQVILALPENQLWAADLRDNVLALRERNVRKRSRQIWKSLRWAVWTAILLLIFQLGNFGLSGFNYLRQSKINELEPRAIRVENKLTLAQRLTQSTEEDVRPFLLMESINPLRPDSIFFENVRARTYNQLQIEGRSAEGVTPVNAFADSIGQLPIVENVQNNSQTRNNQTSFEFLITFASIPEAPEGGFVIPSEEDGEEPSEVEEDNG